MLLFAAELLNTDTVKFTSIHQRACYRQFSFLTGSMFVSLCRNDSSLVFVQMLFCSAVARPENAAHIDDAANVDGGYIKNFSSKKGKQIDGKKGLKKSLKINI